MYLLSVLAVLVAISMVPTVLSSHDIHQPIGDFTVPNWVKNNAGWWADGQIDDSSFVSGIQWLISNDVITIPSTIQGTGDGDSIIHSWVKNTAGWWAEDKIHDVTFVAAIRYLINEGIMIVEQELEEAEEPVEDVVVIRDFYMEVNSGSCTYCVSWAYVGEEYNFQIETYDEKNGNYIDEVKINAKIISKGGELRHDFGQVTTEEGIYKNSIIIPSMDWYAENILSVTGEYYGVEKTIEKEFEVFRNRTGGSGITQTGAGGCAEVPPVSVSSQDTLPTAVAFSNDGLKMFIVGNTGNDVNEYTLDGAYCLGDVTFVDAFSVESEDTLPHGIAFSNDGTKMFIAGNEGKDVNEYTLTVPFDVSTASFVDAFSVASEGTAKGIAFNSDGTKMFIVDGSSTSDDVGEYTLTVPFDVSTASYVDAFSVASEETAPEGIAFNSDGTKMFIAGNDGNDVNEYTLTVPFDVSTASFVDAFSVSTQEGDLRDIAFDPTGRYMFIVGVEGDDVNVYKLTVPFDVSTASALGS